MSSLTLTLLPILSLALTQSTTALPLTLHNLTKRKSTRSTGATVGLAVGIAIAALLAIAIIAFLIFHFRRHRHLAQLNLERAILAGEKNKDGSDKVDKFATPPPQPPAALTRADGTLKRNKSVKDRLMGPLYRGSTIELPKMPNQRGSEVFEDGDSPLVTKPWAESSPRPSFSSRRATRMMMMM